MQGHEVESQSQRDSSISEYTREDLTRREGYQSRSMKEDYLNSVGFEISDSDKEEERNIQIQFPYRMVGMPIRRKRLNFKIIKNSIRTFWGSFAKPFVSALKYSFRFRTQEETDVAIRKGPWSFEDRWD